MRGAKKQNRDRDPHSKAVYDLEDGFLEFGRETLTLPQVRRWVERACWCFRLKPPPIRQHDHGGPTFTMSDGSLICFKRRHKNPAIALHEAAHYICDRLHGDNLQTHGPTWLGIYCYLLVVTRIVPPESLKAALAARKLRVRPICPAQLRKSLTPTSRVRP